MNKIIILSCTTILIGCGTQNAIHFATNTEIGVGIDPIQQAAVVGLDRSEIIVTPNSRGGEVPAVYAEVQSNRSLSSPEISQIYVTGDAAALVTSPDINLSGEGKEEDTPYRRDKRRMLVFGTTTNLGFKGALGQASVPVFNLGYKRKEASRIPLPEFEENTSDDDTNSKTHKMPSLFAFLRVSNKLKKINTDDGDKLQNQSAIATAIPFDLSAGQLIATGVAAENLARNPAIRGAFVRRVEKASEGDLPCESLEAGASKDACEAEAKAIKEQRDVLVE